MDDALIKKALEEMGVKNAESITVGPCDENGLVKITTEFKFSLGLSITVFRTTREEMIAFLIKKAADAVWPPKDYG